MLWISYRRCGKTTTGSINTDNVAGIKIHFWRRQPQNDARFCMANYFTKNNTPDKLRRCD